MSEGKRSTFVEIGEELGKLVEQKDASYGSAVAKIGDVLRVMCPNGVRVEHLGDLAAVVRVIDKLFRILTAPGAYGEDPWKDIAGYALVKVEQGRRKRSELFAPSLYSTVGRAEPAPWTSWAAAFGSDMTELGRTYDGDGARLFEVSAEEWDRACAALPRALAPTPDELSASELTRHMSDGLLNADGIGGDAVRLRLRRVAPAESFRQRLEVAFAEGQARLEALVEESAKLGAPLSPETLERVSEHAGPAPHRLSEHEMKGGVLACTRPGCACGPGCIHEGFVSRDAPEAPEEAVRAAVAAERLAQAGVRTAREIRLQAAAEELMRLQPDDVRPEGWENQLATGKVDVLTELLEATAGLIRATRAEHPLSEPKRVEMWCPFCGHQHEDVGEWASRPHQTHLCASCKAKWTVEPRVYGVRDPVMEGVRFGRLPPRAREVAGAVLATAPTVEQFARIEAAVRGLFANPASVTPDFETLTRAVETLRELHDSMETEHAPYYQRGYKDALERAAAQCDLGQECKDTGHSSSDCAAHYIREMANALNCPAPETSVELEAALVRTRLDLASLRGAVMREVDNLRNGGGVGHVVAALATAAGVSSGVDVARLVRAEEALSGGAGRLDDNEWKATIPAAVEVDQAGADAAWAAGRECRKAREAPHGSGKWYAAPARGSRPAIAWPEEVGLGKLEVLRPGKD